MKNGGKIIHWFIFHSSLRLTTEQGAQENAVHHRIACAENINFTKPGTMGAISVPLGPAYHILEKTGVAISFWMWFFLIPFYSDVWKCEAAEAFGEGRRMCLGWWHI